MATFARLEPSADPMPALAPLHLGKRLLRERTRLGILLDDAALALQTDRHTIVTLESGDAVPPRLSSRLRTYLHQLEAQPAPANSSPLPQVGEGQGEGPADDEPPAPPPAPKPGRKPRVGMTDWDAGHLYTEMDTRRRALGLTWPQAAEQIGIHVISLRKLPQASYLKTTTRAKLVAWLTRTAPSPATEDPMPAPDPIPPHPAILSDTIPTVVEAMFNPAPADASAPPPCVGEGMGERSASPADAQALAAAHRLFISHTIHLHLPDAHPALTALLQKFPDFDQVDNYNRSQWFQSFLKLAELALTGDSDN